MKKKFILRLTRLFTAIAAIVGIALHPTSKLVDGVSGATRQKNHISTSDNSNVDSNNDDITVDNGDNNSNITPRPSNISPSINYNSTPTITLGWVKEGEDWIYNLTKGSKATGWLNDGGKWYYFSYNGVMSTGWIQTGGKWYYLASSGEMRTGWIKDNSGSWYYLDDSGAMLANTTIGGYTLGLDGKML